MADSEDMRKGAELFKDPAAYCRLYYSFEEGSDELEHPVIKKRLLTLHEFYKQANLKSARILELGGGPTICSLISAVQYADSITFTDIGEQNIEFLNKWKVDPGTFDFSSLIRYTVEEVEGSSSEEVVKARQDLLRSKIETIVKADVTDDDPVDASLVGQFDVVSVHYCLLHAVKTHDDYPRVLKNLGRYLKVGGILLLSEMLGCFHAQRQFEEKKQEMSSDGEHQHKHDHHHHKHDHEAKTKQFIFDSVKSGGFEEVVHKLIFREAPKVDLDIDKDPNAWTTVLIMAKKV
eukprot:m.61287 g.61287  ORF g.61287 m.61287 type:complete len:291 (+) comp34989_c0_seq1:103-975(+)